MSVELKEKITKAIQSKMPHLNNEAAELVFFSMVLRSSELGLDAFGGDRDILEAYEQYQMWKSLNSTGKVEEDDYSILFRIKKL